MNKEEMRYNPETGEELYRDIRKIEIVYQDRKMKFDMPGWYPADNDEGIFDKEDMKVYSKAINRLKAESEGLLLPEQIREIRRMLKLTQHQAGEVIGGGKRAFQKYESGEVIPSRAASNLLKVLNMQPALLSIL